MSPGQLPRGFLLARDAIVDYGCRSISFADRHCRSPPRRLFKAHAARTEKSPTALHLGGWASGTYYILMAAILPKKKNRYTRTWVIEGFDGTTCFFRQTLSETFLPDVRIIVLLQRLLSRHLSPKDIIDGSTTRRDPLHNPIFGTRREIVEGGVSITVGENPYFVATRRRRPYTTREKR